MNAVRKAGDIVKVRAVKTPGHERREYIGKVINVSIPDTNGRQSISVRNNVGTRVSPEWAHQTSLLIGAKS